MNERGILFEAPMVLALDSQPLGVGRVLQGAAVSSPLPWHDVPKCKARRECGAAIADFSDNGGGYCCAACGAAFSPSPEERVQLKRAEAAWNLVLAGKAHEDRGCARCGGVLPIEQQRLCPPCVKADEEERNLSLFPGLTPAPQP